MTTIFIISAPSGSGKSTLVSRLLARDRRLRFSVSYTTRKPRGNEKPGDSYVYISREESEEGIQRRLRDAAEEIGNYVQYDYVLVNHQLEESVNTLFAIVSAERVRRVRMEDQIQPILHSFEDRVSSLF